MSDFYLGEIRAFAGNWAPPCWLPCDGRSMQIVQYSALYALLGTKFGGDGQKTFFLPDLRGRFVAGVGTNQRLGTSLTIGQTTTVESITLSNQNMLPAHIHAATFAVASSNATLTVAVADSYGGQASPSGTVLAQSGLSQTVAANTYSSSATTGAFLGGVTVTGGSITGGTVALGNTGGSPVSVMSPYLAVTYMIAIAGLWPSRQ